MKQRYRTHLAALTACLALLLLPKPVRAESLPAKMTSEKDGAQLILIPAGPFVLGMNPQDTKTLVVKKLHEKMQDFYSAELSQQTKTLGNYYIDQYEVTNAQYERFLSETKHRPPQFWKFPQFNGKRQPVVGVGWADAEAYCGWANRRLPTEEEWEKAARGTDGRIWPWGNDPDDEKFNGKKQAQYAPVNVGSYPTGDSPYGVSDMAGNVWEMTSSAWGDGSKAMKGGSFLNTSGDVRAAVRWSAQDEKDGANWLGFRCAADAR